MLENMLVFLVTIVKVPWTSLNGSIIKYLKKYITIIQNQVIVKENYDE